VGGTVLKTVLLLCCPFLLLVGACANVPTSEEPPTNADGGSPSREAEILFPRMKRSTGHEALVVGRLVADGAGCLRLRGGTGDGTVPLWMRGWELKTGGGSPRVLDDEGRTVGRVGGKVALGGSGFTKGMLEDDALVDGRTTARELLERCPGDYWLVSGDSDL
jgi:hypothetical protein